MKTKLSNITLEGTDSGDVVDGLLSWTGKSLQALLFLKGGFNAGKGKRTGCPSGRVCAHFLINYKPPRLGAVCPGNKKPLEKGKLQGRVRGVSLPSDVKDK